MTNTRYGHSNASGGNQDAPERKDDGWERRQGGPQSREPGRSDAARGRPSDEEKRRPPRGTNTQGDRAGIGEAAEASQAALETGTPPPDAALGVRDRDARGAGTDQPPRMSGPMGGDPEHPHLPEGAQDTDTRGSGAGGFDRGVNAKNVGAVHQGVREEDDAAAT